MHCISCGSYKYFVSTYLVYWHTKKNKINLLNDKINDKNQKATYHGHQLKDINHVNAVTLDVEDWNYGISIGKLSD